MNLREKTDTLDDMDRIERNLGKTVLKNTNQTKPAKQTKTHNKTPHQTNKARKRNQIQ